MGLLTIIRKQKLKDKDVRVLILGLDNSGKTTIVKRLLNQNTNEVSPTMGFNIETMIIPPDIRVNIWDIGGQSSLRSFWDNYFEKTDFVIWVIDALAAERLQESFQELREKIIHSERLTTIKLLVMINKADVLLQENQHQFRNKVITLLNRDQMEVAVVSARLGMGMKHVFLWITHHYNSAHNP